MALLNLTYFFLILPEHQSDENYCFAHHHSKGLPGAKKRSFGSQLRAKAEYVRHARKNSYNISRSYQARTDIGCCK